MVGCAWIKIKGLVSARVLEVIKGIIELNNAPYNDVVVQWFACLQSLFSISTGHNALFTMKLSKNGLRCWFCQTNGALAIFFPLVNGLV